MTDIPEDLLEKMARAIDDAEWTEGAEQALDAGEEAYNRFRANAALAALRAAGYEVRPLPAPPVRREEV